MRRHELEERAGRGETGSLADASVLGIGRPGLPEAARKRRRRSRNCCSTTFGLWRSSSMTCAASEPIRALRSISAPCAPKSKP